MYEFTPNTVTASEYLNTTRNMPDVSVSPISRQATLIQKLLAEHRELQSAVEQRLHSVLKPSGPCAAEQANGQPRAATSPMATDLESFADALQRLLSGYQDILNRLEL